MLLFAWSVLAMAQSAGREEAERSRWALDNSLLSELGLTEGQQEKVLSLEESYQREIAPLRSQIFEKRTEARLLWAEIHCDPEKIRVVEREIYDLVGQLREKYVDYRLGFREILTPDQAAKFVALTEAGIRPDPRRLH